MRRSGILLTVIAGAALGAVAPASAATIATTRACLNEGSPAQWVGTGFAPGVVVKIRVKGLIVGQAPAAPDGSVAVPFTAPLGNPNQPGEPYAFEATDGTSTAQGTAGLQRPGATLASVGRTRVQMRLQLAGYEPGQVIYAHLRWNQRWRRSVALGTAAGPCGTLDVKRKLLRKTSGRNFRTVFVQFDANRKPSTGTHQTAYARFYVTRGRFGNPEIYRRVTLGWRERTGI